ncbi:MAG: YbhB/YbcL family Raf kinase inhibitor-like protein [Burkholderiaceae bacterium]
MGIRSDGAWRVFNGLVAASLLLAQAACAPSLDADGIYPVIELSSPDLTNESIPKKNTCDGEAISPALNWSAVPENTRSLVLLVTAKDSPLTFITGPFVHWVLYDLPPQTRGLPEGVPAQELRPDGSKQGKNGFDRTGYLGPCPVGPYPHRYSFTLYALDSSLNLPGGASKSEVLAAMQGHVVGQGRFVGRYQR